MPLRVSADGNVMTNHTQQLHLHNTVFQWLQRRNSQTQWGTSRPRSSSSTSPLEKVEIASPEPLRCWNNSVTRPLFSLKQDTLFDPLGSGVMRRLLATSLSGARKQCSFLRVVWRSRNMSCCWGHWRALNSFPPRERGQAGATTWGSSTRCHQKMRSLEIGVCYPNGSQRQGHRSSLWGPHPGKVPQGALWIWRTLDFQSSDLW